MRSIHRYGSAALVLVGLACQAETTDPSELPSPPDLAPAVGTNLAPLSDWSSETTSVDMFKASRVWFSGSEQQWEDGESLDLDEHGWVRSLRPGQFARTIMASNGAHYPTGKYQVFYDGEGTIEYMFSGTTDRLESDGSGRHVLDVGAETGGISLTIIETNPNDYIRNIRVVMAGGACDADTTRWCDDENPCAEGDCSLFEDSYQEQLFYPEFIASSRDYGVLRFMDWMHTNDSTQRTWDDRPRPSDASWSRGGVPVEIMVELANLTGRDPWFNMPHMADDEYMENFAVYVRDHLAPGRKAYVEYSNEVWNSLFPQASYAAERGLGEGLGPSEFEAQMLFYARRATEMNQIWGRVFSGQSDRLVRVMASQAGNAWVSRILLDSPDATSNTDALAIAPYFGSNLGNPELSSRIESMDLDQLFSELRAVSVPEAVASVAEHAAVAKARSVELVAYEGGQHLAGVAGAADNEAINRLFDAANRDPRMRELYADYLGGWRKNGGHVFVHFTSCGVPDKFGRWGAREWLQQPRSDAPKLDAILQFAEQNPRWW
jgi:hypothetical protein